MKLQGGSNLSCSDFSFYLFPKVTHTIRNPYNHIADRVVFGPKTKIVLFTHFVLFKSFFFIVLFLTFQLRFLVFDFHYLDMRCFMQIELLCKTNCMSNHCVE